MLALYGLPMVAVWRASSMIIAIPIFLFVATPSAGVAPYASAMTGLLFTTAIAYVVALGAALGEPPNTPG